MIKQFEIIRSKGAIINIMALLFVLDVLMLIFFGKKYVEIELIYPIYVHDFVLLMLFLGSFFVDVKESRVFWVELLVVFASLYLLRAILVPEPNTELLIILRQFMLFGYIILMYPVSRAFNSSYDLKQISFFIKGVALCSIIIQVVYVLFVFIMHQKSPFFGKYYFSPMFFFASIIAGAYLLTSIGSKKKYLYFLILLILCFTSGHDSNYLSLLVVLATYLFLKFNRKWKLISVILSVVSVIVIFITVPGFNDVNSQWRLFYWKDVVKNLISNYLVFGNGFGGPYISEESANKLHELVLMNGFDFEYNTWLTPSHNSFLTICHHIGVFGLVFLYLPAANFSKYTKNNDFLFLFLVLTGFSVFTSFNVVLELPHLSAMFWLIYFTFVFKLKELNIN